MRWMSADLSTHRKSFPSVTALMAVRIYSNAGLPPIGIRDLHPYFAVSREILSPLPPHIITTSGFSVIRQLLFQGPSVLHTRAECLFVQSSARSADPGNAAWALRSIPTTEFAIAQKQNHPFVRFCFWQWKWWESNPHRRWYGRKVYTIVESLVLTARRLAEDDEVSRNFLPGPFREQGTGKLEI